MTTSCYARSAIGLRGQPAKTEQVYSSSVGKEIVDATRKCPMCGHTTWVLLDGYSTLQALEGGLEALAYSCDECGFIRWHRMDKSASEVRPR
jgi:predicted RNA-binding Zn-ribbon protein involved in translation (DUF1610 family)